MKTVVRLLIRNGFVSEQTMAVFLVRVFNGLAAIKSEARTLRWYAIVTIFHAIDWTGANAAAEWFSRVSGLRAQLKSVLGEAE